MASKTCSLVLACLVLGLGFASHARAQHPLRVVLRIASQADRALVPRLRGQLSDVAAQLIVTDTAPLEVGLAKQREVARMVGRVQDADAVVWCAGEPDAKRRVLLELTRSDRVLSRALAGGASGDLRSSDLETAALFVRSALVALGQDVAVGAPADAAALSGDMPSAAETSGPSAASARSETGDAVAADRGASSDAARPIRGVAESAALAADGGTQSSVLARLRGEGVTRDQGARSAKGDDGFAAISGAVDRAEPRTEGAGVGRVELHARLMLGAQVALDGQSSSGQRGLSARAGLEYGRWAINVFGVFAMASTIADPYFALSVARHALGMAVERVLPLSETLALGVALHAGALLLRRTSRAQNASAVSMPASLTAAAALGPELALSWLPGRFGVSLRFGLDVLPDAPRFEIAGLSPQLAAVSHSLWSIEPRMTLGWETALP